VANLTEVVCDGETIQKPDAVMTTSLCLWL